MPERVDRHLSHQHRHADRAVRALGYALRRTGRRNSRDGNDRVRQLIRDICCVAVTATVFTGIRRITVLGTSRRSYDRLIIVAGSIHGIGRVAVIAHRTGVRRIAACRTGRRRYDRLIIVAGSIHGIGRVAVIAHRTGVGGISVLGAGGGRYCGGIGVSRSGINRPSLMYVLTTSTTDTGCVTVFGTRRCNGRNQGQIMSQSGKNPGNRLCRNSDRRTAEFAKGSSIRDKTGVRTGCRTYRLRHGRLDCFRHAATAQTRNRRRTSRVVIRPCVRYVTDAVTERTDRRCVARNFLTTNGARNDRIVRAARCTGSRYLVFTNGGTWCVTRSIRRLIAVAG